ncbi:MAG: hypothetical protein ACFE89_08170 [Candidatus Hodarchaeota archaeon]
MRVLLVILLFSMVISPSVPLPSPAISTFRGTDLTLTVQLRDLSGNPIDNATVHFFHEQQNTLLGTALTNITGHATFIWLIPLTHPLGIAQLNATFRGDPERFLLPSMVPIPITIYAQIHTTISVKDANGQPVGSKVNIGQQLFFHVLIQDDHMFPMANITVQLLKEPNQLLNQAVTPMNGSLTFNYTVNVNDTAPIVFTIQSLDYGYYNGTANTIPFVIHNSSTYFVGLPAFWQRDRGFEIQGRLCHTSGEGIANASIEILQESRVAMGLVRTEPDGSFFINLINLLDQLYENQFIILRYNGSIGYSCAEEIIGILPNSLINPFSHTIDLTPPLGLALLLQQIGIITLSCITVTTTLISWRMKRSTNRIVAH